MTHRLKRIKPKRVSDQVFEQLRNLIYKGELKPEEKLLPERELAQVLGVSRPTIREAIQKLISMGLLEQKQGQGTFVRSSASKASTNPFAHVIEGHGGTLEELLEVRMGLECNAVALAAQRATGDDIKALQKYLDAIIVEVKEGGLGIDADVSFHMAIAFATKNSIHIFIMKNLYDLLFFGIKENLNHLYSKPGNIDIITQHHEKIFNCIKIHDPDRAFEAMKEHINFVLKFLEERIGFLF